MTGFGAAGRTWEDGPEGRPAHVGVELRGVNQRFLELKLRVPFGAAVEQEVRRRLEARIGRGRVDAVVFVQRQAAAGAPAALVDEARALEVLAAARRVADLALREGLEVLPINPLQLLGNLGAQKGASTTPEGPLAAVPPFLLECVDEALDAKEKGEKRVILFNLSGHGHFDLASYEKYLQGSLEDYEYPTDKVEESLAHLPQVG